MEREQAIKLMQDLLKRLVDRKGSDLFITSGFPPAIKVDGEIRPQSERVLTPEQAAVLVRSIMNDKQTQGVRLDQGMQLRDRAGRHRPLPRQRVRAAGPDRLRRAHDQRQDSRRSKRCSCRRS